MIEDAGGGGAFVTIPFDVERAFGKKRVKVKATIAGQPYRGSLVRIGTTCHILGVRKEIRERAGAAIGDEIEVLLEEDTEPRELALPEDVRQALESAPEANACFAKLSYSHQREYLEWIEEAKRAETRSGRIARMVEQLSEGSPAGS